MNNLVKDLKIQCLKFVESSCEENLIRKPTYINEIFQKLWFL